MTRSARLWNERWLLAMHPRDPLTETIKRVEGRRWEKTQQAWSLPATLRTWKLLDVWGFRMLLHGSGPTRIQRLKNRGTGDAPIIDWDVKYSDVKGRAFRKLLKELKGKYPIIRLRVDMMEQLLKTPIATWPLFVLAGQREAKEFFPWALEYCAAKDSVAGWNYSGVSHADELRDELSGFTVITP